MKSRLSIVFLMIGLISMSTFNGVQAQNSPPDIQAMTMLRDFYTNYLKEFTDLSSARGQKLNAILKKYCTASLINKVPKLTDQINGDPFLKAQAGISDSELYFFTFYFSLFIESSTSGSRRKSIPCIHL